MSDLSRLAGADLNVRRTSRIEAPSVRPNRYRACTRSGGRRLFDTSGIQTVEKEAAVFVI